MQVALQQQQAARNYVLAKIDRIYTDQKMAEAKRRLQVVRYQRRQLANARTIFQKQLDQAVSLKLQDGLGMEIIVDPRCLPRLHLVVRFEFLGKQWLIVRKKSLWESQWYFQLQGESVFTRCTTKNLEERLCYALGKYKNSLGHKIRFLTASPISHES